MDQEPDLNDVISGLNSKFHSLSDRYKSCVRNLQSPVFDADESSVLAAHTQASPISRSSEELLDSLEKLSVLIKSVHSQKLLDVFNESVRSIYDALNSNAKEKARLLAKSKLLKEQIRTTKEENSMFRQRLLVMKKSLEEMEAEILSADAG